MGCICSKVTRANDNEQKNKAPSKQTTKASKHSKGDEVVIDVDGKCNENNNVDEDDDKKILVPDVSRLLSLAGVEKGEPVIAGWPSWLTAVAGEAINGWVPRRVDSFEKLDKVGQGTYSNVYRARDLEANKIVALKKVRFANKDPESVRFMAREIIILRKLDHPNVMKLEGIITSKMSGSLYLIFEYMEHDLAGLLARPGVKFTETQIKCYMQQLLHGLEHCHSRGVLHRDIKGSNLLINQDGNLKIADFGLATFFSTPQKQPLTSRVVTLWYRSPELLLGATSYAVSVDLWSSGCILAELFTGKPIMPGRTEVEQLHKIFKLCGSPSEEYWKRSKLPHATVFKPQQPYKRCIAETFKDLPSSSVALLDVLLAIEPEDRKTAIWALNSEFFTESPLPCDPSSLPKFPPTKELDTKLRNEDARRCKGGKGRGHELSTKSAKASRAMPAPDTNAELSTAKLKPKKQSNPKSISGKHNHPGGGGTLRNINLHATSHSSLYGIRDHGQASTNYKKHKELKNQISSNPLWPEDGYDRQYYSKLDISSHHMMNGRKLDKQGSSSNNSESLMKKRMNYSGPLMAAAGDIDEMLKEHERHIQEAVRKARIDKTFAKNGKNRSPVLLQGAKW